MLPLMIEERMLKQGGSEEDENRLANLNLITSARRYCHESKFKT